MHILIVEDDAAIRQELEAIAGKCAVSGDGA